MTCEQARDILIAAYQAEVEYRHGVFMDDKRCIESIGRLAEVLTMENPKFGIMLCGTCGNGKTTLLYAFRSALNMLSRQHLWEGPKGIMVIDANEVAMSAKNIQRFRDLRSEDMLAIEDMGREPTEVMDYGNVLTPVIDLLEYRYNEQLFTIVTTNLTADEIRAKYKPRIADRFNEMLEVIIFGSKSFRGGRQEHSRTSSGTSNPTG